MVRRMIILLSENVDIDENAIQVIGKLASAEDKFNIESFANTTLALVLTSTEEFHSIHELLNI